MTTPGERGRPLRVAVVGAGPAGFYTVEALLKHAGLEVDVDLFERLPAPYGLLRYGVAPDHPKIKSVSVAYDRLCDDPRVRFLGNVAVGSEAMSVEDLVARYDQVVVATGCETDRRLGIPGEDLEGSHSATSFVAWYNGHPDYASLRVDLGVERAVVVGIGDVAMDLARVLLRDPADLRPTDITSYAHGELERSRIREVVILARRSPAEAAFAAKELEDIAELAGVGVHVEEPIVREALGAVDPHASHEKHKLEVLHRLACAPVEAPRRLRIRFLASPVEILEASGRVAGIRIEHNELVRSDRGDAVARGSGRFEEIEAGLVVRSIGYHGVALPGLPFDWKRGLIPNAEGRVLAEGSQLPRLYVAGWIKRGATGVVGTNKGDAAATVQRMIADIPSLEPRSADAVARSSIDSLLADRGVEVVHWHGWKRIDAKEKERGLALGKVREKLTRVDELVEASKEQ